MKNSAVKMCGLVLLGLSGSAMGSVIGVELNTNVRVGTADQRWIDDDFYVLDTVDSMNLYEPHIHTVGSESLMVPADPRVAEARFISSEVTVGNTRTLTYRIETVTGGAFAQESLFDDLVPAEFAQITPFAYGEAIDPERTSDVQKTYLMYGIDGEVLRRWALQPSNREYMEWGISYHTNSDNPFGTSFFGGTPVAFEAVYTYTIAGCTGDLTGDGELDFLDVSAFLNAYSVEDPSVDFNADGIFNFFDVSAFLQAFSNGCP